MPKPLGPCSFCGSIVGPFVGLTHGTVPTGEQQCARCFDDSFERIFGFRPVMDQTADEPIYVAAHLEDARDA